MNEITPSTLTQVIVYHDGTFKMITDPQASLIFQASAGTQSKSIITPQLGLITFSAIAKIISLEEFYTQYPKHRPEEPQYTYKNETRLLDQVRQPTKKAMELMVQGFVNQRRIKNPNYTLEQAQKEFTLFKKSL